MLLLLPSSLFGIVRWFVGLLVSLMVVVVVVVVVLIATGASVQMSMGKYGKCVQDKKTRQDKSRQKCATPRGDSRILNTLISTSAQHGNDDIPLRIPSRSFCARPTIVPCAQAVSHPIRNPLPYTTKPK